MHMRLVKSLPLFLLLASMGCAVKNPLTIVRPNARTALEEKTYNLLKASEKLLDVAMECDINLEDGCEIADFMRPVLDVMEQIHNEALEASLTYVAFLDVGDDPSTASIEDLENLILRLERQVTRIISGGGGE